MRGRTLTLLEKAFIAYMLVVSLSLLFQPKHAWTWLLSDVTLVYEAEDYVVKVGRRGPPLRPLVMANTVVGPIPVLEVSDYTVYVDGRSLREYKVRDRVDGAYVAEYYNGSERVLVKRVEPSERGVRVSIKGCSGRRVSGVGLWAWYFVALNGRPVYLREGVDELNWTGSLVASVNVYGVTHSVRVSVEPQPEKVVLYADEVGVNRVELVVNATELELNIDPGEGYPLELWRGGVVVVSLILAAVYVAARKRGLRAKSRLPPERVALFLVVAGIVARVVVAPFTMHVWDVTTVQEAVHLLYVGRDPYEYVRLRTEALRNATGLPLHYEGYTYPPHAAYMFLPFYLAYLSLGFAPRPILGGHEAELTELELAYPDIYYFLLMIKLPLILCDVALIALLYRRDPRLAAIYAIHPYPLLITSVWGHFDGVVGLLLALSVLLAGRRPFSSGLLYGLSLMKMYTVVCLGAFLSGLDRRSVWKFACGLALAQAPTLLEVALNGEDFLQAVAYHGVRQMGGVNMFSAVYFLTSSPYALTLSKAVGAVFAASVLLANAYVVRKRMPVPRGAAVLMLTYLAFAPVNNEQYLASTLPLLALFFEFPSTLSLMPALYAFFRSPGYLYFLTPALFASVHTRRAWEMSWKAWYRAVAALYPAVFYVIGAATSLLLLYELVNYLGSGAVARKPEDLD